MAAYRRFARVFLPLILAAVATAPASAGVRVTGSVPPPAQALPEFRSWASFQLGFGVSGGDAPNSPGGSVTIESALWRTHHLLLRVDRFQFRERYEWATSGLVPVPPSKFEGSLTTAQAGIRVGPEGRIGRVYLDAVVGAGWSGSVLTIGPREFHGDEFRAIAGPGLGASWVPNGSAVGGFIEGRVDVILGSESGSFQSGRAGLLIRWPTSTTGSRDSLGVRRSWEISRVRGGGR